MIVRPSDNRGRLTSHGLEASLAQCAMRRETGLDMSPGLVVPHGFYLKTGVATEDLRQPPRESPNDTVPLGHVVSFGLVQC